MCTVAPAPQPGVSRRKNGVDGSAQILLRVDRTSMSRRKRLASLLHQTGLVRAALALRATTPSQWLTILTYHRFPDPSGEELFDDEVIDAAPDVFERQIACLKRHF